MHRRRQSLRGLELWLSLFAALAWPALGAGCGDDDDSSGGVDAGQVGTGGMGTGGVGTGGVGTGGVGTGGMGTGGSGGTGSGGMGSGGMGGEEDAGLDGGSSGGDGNDGTFRTVAIAMTDMTPHVGDLMEFRIVDADNNLVARGMLDPLPAPTATYPFPHAAPTSGDLRLDFYADLSGNRMYDAPPTDHAWRVKVPAGDPATITFMHNTNFTDISMPALHENLDFTFSAQGMTPEMNDPLELRVIDADTKQLVGRYVLGKVAGASVDLAIPGIVKSGHTYQVDFFTDVNGNGDYDAPPTDHAWRVKQAATSSGLSIQFTHSTTYQDVGF